VANQPIGIVGGLPGNSPICQFHAAQLKDLGVAYKVAADEAKNFARESCERLRELLETRLQAIEEKEDIRFGLSQTAICKAEIQMNERLTGMNEFRETLRDQSTHFVTRTESELMLVSLRTEVQGLRESRIKLDALASARSVQVAQALALLGIFVGIASLLVRAFYH